MSIEDEKKKNRVDEVSLSAKELFRAAGKLFNENNFMEAIEAYSKAIRLKPDYASAFFNRALCFVRLSRYEEAVADLEKVAELEPNAPDVPYLRGRIAELQNDYEAGKKWYEKSLALDANFEMAKNELALLEVRTLSIESASEKIRENMVLKTLLQLQAEKETLALPVLSIDDLDEAAEFVEQLDFKESHVRGLVTSEVAPRVALRYADNSRIDKAKKFLTEAFRALQDWNIDEFRKNTILQRLLLNFVWGSDYSLKHGSDIDQAIDLWRLKIEKRIEAAKHRISFNEWLLEGTQIDDGQNIVEQGLNSLRVDTNDDFVESCAFDFEAMSLDVQIWKQGLTEELREAYKHLWHTVETRQKSVSKYIVAGILQRYLLVSSPKDLDAQHELELYSDLLSPYHLMTIFGYWSLADHAYLEEFNAAMKEYACRTRSMARCALLCFLGQITPVEALKRVASEEDLNKDLVKAVIEHQPIKDVLKIHLERGSFLKAESELVRKFLNKDDMEALIALSLIRNSTGVLGLLLKDCIEHDDLLPAITIGIDFGGVWKILYKNMEELLKQSSLNDFNILTSSLVKIVMM